MFAEAKIPHIAGKRTPVLKLSQSPGQTIRCYAGYLCASVLQTQPTRIDGLQRGKVAALMLAIACPRPTLWSCRRLRFARTLGRPVE